MRKKSGSGVLASLRGSPYGREYAFASSLAAALLDGLFAHPAGYSDTDTACELIATHCAAIEFFFGCCYGAPLQQSHPWISRLLKTLPPSC